MSIRVPTVARTLCAGDRGWILVAIAAGWLFIVGGRFLIPAVLPQVMSSFSVGNTGGGIAVTIIWATYGLMQAPAGILTDRYGERRLLAGSLFLSVASVMALSVAPVYAAFVVGCAAFGFATGLYGPPRGTALSRLFRDVDGSAIGVTLAAGSLGSAVLPFFAGALIGSVSWQYIVIALVPPLAVAGVLSWWAIPERSRSHESETLPLRTLVDEVTRAIRLEGIRLGLVGITLALFVFQGFSAFYVTYLVTVKGFSQTVAAGMLSVLFITGALAQVGSGVITKQVGEQTVLTGISVLGVLGMALVPFADGFVVILTLSALLGVQQAIFPISNAYMIAILPASARGSTWGVLRTAFFLISAAGSTVVGLLADRDLFDMSFFLLAILAGVAAICYLYLPARRPVT